MTAFDKKGNYLTDLRPDDVEVYEDGQKQTLKFFIPCAAQGADGGVEAPLHLGVLFDISGSMEEDLAFARSAAIKFLNSLSEAHDFTLVDFDTEVRVARFSQAEFARLVERIRSRKAEGYTALYDAIGVYLDGASMQDGRKILVLYTDGGDNASNINFNELLDLLKASDVTVYAIGFLEHQSSSVKMDQRGRLQRIAELTGGQAFFPMSMKDLDGAYQKVAAEIRLAVHARLPLDQHQAGRHLAEGRDQDRPARPQRHQAPHPPGLLRAVEGRPADQEIQSHP